MPRSCQRFRLSIFRFEQTCRQDERKENEGRCYPHGRYADEQTEK